MRTYAGPLRLARAVRLGLALAAGAWLATAQAAEMGVPPATASGTGEIPYELWDRPRSGRTVLAVPAVREAMAALAANPSARLLIRHPADGAGTLQAEELRTWLIAHAVAPARLVLRPERSPREPLELHILP